MQKGDAGNVQDVISKTKVELLLSCVMLADSTIYAQFSDSFAYTSYGNDI